MALLHAIPLTLFILALIYKWFALDDRYAIFLYYHSLGTSAGPGPFDQVTVSRYWMTGLVANGIIMLAYIATNVLLARLNRAYRAPAGWRVWLLCAVPLAIGIPLIVMNANAPTMPPLIALAITGATLIGLAVALMPGSLAAHRPRELAWIALDGLGIVPVLLLLRAIELPSRGLAVSDVMAHVFEIGSMIFGVGWLVATHVFRRARRIASPKPIAVFVAGLGWSYLVLPLVHHLVAPPPEFRYITTAYNFFASDVYLQGFTFFIALLLAVGMAKLGDIRIRIPKDEQ